MDDIVSRTDTEELSRVIINESTKRSRIRMAILAAQFALFCLMILILSRLLAAPPATMASANNLLRTTLWVLCFTIVFSLLSGFAMYRLSIRPSRLQRRAALKLTESKDVQAVAGLFESNSFLQDAPRINAALLELLPKLRREHVTLFSDKQIRGMTLGATYLMR